MTPHINKYESKTFKVTKSSEECRVPLDDEAKPKPIKVTAWQCDWCKELHLTESEAYDCCK